MRPTTGSVAVSGLAEPRRRPATRPAPRRGPVAAGLLAVVLAAAVPILGQVLAAPAPAATGIAAAPATAPTATTATYTVRRGDYLYGIARATGTDFATLLELNGLTARSLILPGQVLKVAGSGGDTGPADAPAWSGATYTVRRGDYLYGIARATGTDFATLLELNGLTARSLILPGQVLKVAGSGGDTGPADAPAWSGATYTVRRGDYLYGIARATGTDFATLLELNGLTARSLILPGQVLKVAGSAGADDTTTYTVVRGDCWSCIARRFAVPLRELLAVNAATVATMLHPGTVVRLPAGADVVDPPSVDPPPVVAPAAPTAPSPPVVDPWLTARLHAVVGTSRLALAESLAATRVRIVWDESVPWGTEAVTELTLTIRVHPRLRHREGALDNVLAHEFGHVMALAATRTGAIADPAACHEKVADEIASRIRGFPVRAHPTALCTWEEATVIADAVFAQGY